MWIWSWGKFILRRLNSLHATCTPWNKQKSWNRLKEWDQIHEIGTCWKEGQNLLEWTRWGVQRGIKRNRKIWAKFWNGADWWQRIVFWYQSLIFNPDETIVGGNQK